jgi:TonB-dependent starch-binding outer membrane protein SusC
MTDFISGKAAIARNERGQCELKWELTKTLRIMKLAAFFLFTAAMHVSAKGLTQDKITLSLKNAPLEKVFDAIETQSGFVFIYKNETVKDKKVSIQVTNVSLAEALEECLKGQALSYQIVGKSVAIKTIHKEAGLAENGTANGPPLIDVKGKVLNEKGDPVEGVTVRVKGTEKFTLTDKNGEFSLVTVERDAILLFTHITMEAFELKVSGQTELLIKLRTKVSALGEVTVTVNTGYQQVSKERFVGSVSTLDSTAYNQRPGTDIISRLDGMVPGVLFDKKSPNGTQLQNIQIRGLSTLSGFTESASNEPLIIVDNFPFKQDLSSLNPNDIESITVLKDAAATSIWGAQAGNGVIVITTKKGRFNQPLKVSVASNLTVQQKPDLYYVPSMKVADFVDAEIYLFGMGKYNDDLANTTTWPVISPVVEMLAKRKAGLISAQDSATQIDAFKSMDVRRDLDKWVYRQAFQQQHYINLTGGNNIINYSFSGGYNRNLNNIRKSKPDDQFTLNTSTSIRLAKDLEIRTGINYSQGTSKSTGFNMPGKLYPYAQLADAAGNALALPNSNRMAYLDTVGGGNLLDWKYRPLDEVALADRSTVTKFIQLSAAVSYKFTNWLAAKVNFQYANQSADFENYQSVKTYSARNLINQYTNLSQTAPALRNPVPVGGMLDLSHGVLTTQNVRGQIDFNKTFNKKHTITAFVASEVSEAKNSGNNNQILGYNKENNNSNLSIDYLNLHPQYNNLGSRAVPNGNITSPETNRRFVSLIGNVSYTYLSRYTVYGSGRKDGSNAFGVNTNRKWNPLWSVGGSWDVTREKFFNIQWFTSLRLRTSYGYSGNPSNATGLPVISYSSTPAALTNLTRADVKNAPNPNLKWEKVRTINWGLDFVLFKNRISGSVDVFDKRSTDIMWINPPAPSTGVITYTTNAADLKGKGFELGLRSVNVERGIRWQTGINLSHAKTSVERVFFNKVATSFYTGYGLNPSSGKIVYGLASYKWAGLDPMTGDPRGYLGKQASTDYQKLLNDSLNNQVFNGSAIPLYFGNITNTFTWRNLTLFTNITYRLNFYYRKPTINYSELVTSWTGNPDYALRWKNPGDEKFTNVPSFTYPISQDRDNFYALSEVNVLRGDNMRLDDIKLQYNWNFRTAKFPVKNIQLALAANRLNIILWKKDKSDYDPDITGGDGYVSPIAKTWTFSVNVNF